MTDATSDPTLEQASSLSRAYFRALGQRIAELRYRNEMTQGELARILGISQQTVFALERGYRRVRIDWLPVLMATFRVTADDLLGLKPLQPPPEMRISPRRQRHIDTFSGLSDADQNFIMKLVDSMARR